MATFTSENRDLWQGLFDEASRERPGVGRTVRVCRGKHTGKVGVVRRHMVSRYGNPFRYGNEASRAMLQARGRHGFCILIQPEVGSEFFVGADLVMVCVEN